jgi:hypothetical protein
MSTQALIRELKESGQDSEWYPTTDEIIRTIAQDILGKSGRGGVSMLDVGAGDGRVLDRIDKALRERNEERGLYEKYAIEKSDRLIAAMPADVCIIGTDFHRQTLIDKKVDVVFCNPPYSEYEQWVCKIIREANAPYVYLVIPRRWQENKRIAEAVAVRKASTRVIGSHDFLEADRKARCVVDLILVNLARDRSYGVPDTPATDPFDVWFDDTFGIPAPERGTESYTEKETEREKIKGAIVPGRNPVQILSELYRENLDRLLQNYKALESMDAEILREIGVNKSNTREALKQKVKGLKSLYWSELFTCMKSLTDRLTTETRKTMLEKMNKHVGVDFEEQNAYAVIVWALKNVNLYIDSQLVSVYMRMTSPENASGYKSNKHFTLDGWRYNWRRPQDGADPTRYKLDYRIVLQNYYGVQSDKGYSFDYKNGLHTNAHEYVGDVLTICNNLGFSPVRSTYEYQWESGKANDFYYRKDGGEEILCSVKAFKNGNIHIKFNQRAMEAINVEVGRINGWIKTPQDAREELGAREAESLWGSNFKIRSTPLLENKPAPRKRAVPSD